MNDFVDAYQRVIIPRRGETTHLFLYALHFTDANFVQVGFGAETSSELQRAHLPGPQIHEHHLDQFADWLAVRQAVALVEEPSPRTHPMTSVGEPQNLDEWAFLTLTAGRYMPLVDEDVVDEAVVRRFADAVRRVRIKAFGHPLDWDYQHAELKDGRFVWMAYDSDIGKIRIGIGFHNEANDKQYGLHTYAIGKLEAAGFAAHHFQYPDAPLHFMARPPRWPEKLSPFLFGSGKQQFVTVFLALADRVWPGELTGA